MKMELLPILPSYPRLTLGIFIADVFHTVAKASLIIFEYFLFFILEVERLVFDIFLTQWIMAILSKGCKPDNFESHNSLKLSFTNINGLRSNFVECESFLESNSPDIWLYVRQTWMTLLILAISLWQVIFL